MNIEDKLDEDFYFYLAFTNIAQKLENCDEQTLAQLWLQKLCGEPATIVEQKRSRNNFLSNLLLSIYSGKLTEPFDINPNEVDLSDSKRYFPALQSEGKTPQWLHDVDEGGDNA